MKESTKYLITILCICWLIVMLILITPEFEKEYTEKLKFFTEGNSFSYNNTVFLRNTNITIYDSNGSIIFDSDLNLYLNSSLNLNMTLKQFIFIFGYPYTGEYVNVYDVFEQIADQLKGEIDNDDKR